MYMINEHLDILLITTCQPQKKLILVNNINDRFDILIESKKKASPDIQATAS